MTRVNYAFNPRMFFSGPMQYRPDCGGGLRNRGFVVKFNRLSRHPRAGVRLVTAGRVPGRERRSG